MPRDLRTFIERLREAGEVTQVDEALSPHFEVPAAVKYIAKNTGKVAYFTNVKGFKIPIVANLMGTTRRLALGLGVPEEKLIQTYKNRRQTRISPIMVSRAPIHQVIVDKDIDITRLIPVLTHHEKDAGPYMTTSMTIARDPETGTRVMGLHRVQIKGKDTVGVFLATPPLSDTLAKADKLGKPLEVAIVSGLDPVTFFTSCLSVEPGIDKLEVAGGFSTKPIQITRCISIDLEVPAHAEFVLEGYIVPGKREVEGPFGESTGYYMT